jgi:hypothetical protein
LKNIELDYKDDNVKIQIRENSIDAPQYLIMKIKQLIKSMICQTTTLTFQYIPNAFTLTEKDYLQLKVLAKNYNCEIDKIDTETKKELFLLPKGKITSTSKYIEKESKQFYSSLSIPRILLISNNTIEIHKSNDLTVSLLIEFVYFIINFLFLSRLILLLYQQLLMRSKKKLIQNLEMVISNPILVKKYYFFNVHYLVHKKMPIKLKNLFPHLSNRSTHFVPTRSKRLHFQQLIGKNMQIENN